MPYDPYGSMGPQMNIPDLWSMLQSYFTQGPQDDYLGSFLSGNFPHEGLNQVRNALGGSMNRGQSLEEYGGDQYNLMLPGYFDNLNYLQQYGLPGSQQVQGEQRGLGMQGLGGQLLNPYAANLQQILGQGLPNQRGVEDMFGPQRNLGRYYDLMNQDVLSGLAGGNQFLTPQQARLQRQNEDFISGGGLTPEYIAAARRQILEPSKTKLKGDLNQMGGGVASMTSPEFQSILAKQEADFNDSLTMQGLNQLQNFMSRGERMGETGFNQPLNLSSALYAPGQAAYGNAFRSFGDVAGAAAPYYNMAGNTGMGALDQSLNRFSSGSGYGLQNLNTVSDLMARPYQMGQQSAWGNTDRMQNLMNMAMRGGLDYRGQNLAYQSGQRGDYTSLINSLIGERSQNAFNQSQEKLARSGRKGALIGSGIGAGGMIISAAIM